MLKAVINMVFILKIKCMSLFIYFYINPDLIGKISWKCCILFMYIKAQGPEWGNKCNNQNDQLPWRTLQKPTSLIRAPLPPPPNGLQPLSLENPTPNRPPPPSGVGPADSCRHPSADQAWSAPIRAGQLDPTSAWTHAPGL